MGRIDPELLDRIVAFSDRCVALGEHLQEQRRSFRVIDQLIAAGTAVGANCYEADEALSRRDFCKCVGIAIKELNETRFWFEILMRWDWVTEDRLAPLRDEAGELKRILGAILSRTRARQAAL